MSADITALDTPTEQVEADVRRLTLVAAEARTHSPSDRLAWRLDEYLVTHPDAVKAEVPDGWERHIAAVEARNDEGRKRAAARQNRTGGAS